MGGLAGMDERRQDCGFVDGGGRCTKDPRIQALQKYLQINFTCEVVRT